jgi:CHASE2 domain-containing sensor protein
MSRGAEAVVMTLCRGRAGCNGFDMTAHLVQLFGWAPLEGFGMRNRLIVAVSVAYAVLALVAAARGHGVLALAAMLVMLLVMNLWMTPRVRHSDNGAADEGAGRQSSETARASPLHFLSRARVKSGSLLH